MKTSTFFGIIWLLLAVALIGLRMYITNEVVREAVMMTCAFMLGGLALIIAFIRLHERR